MDFRFHDLPLLKSAVLSVMLLPLAPTPAGPSRDARISRGSGEAQRRVTGIVEVPRLFGETDQNAPVTLRRDPAPGSPVVVTVGSGDVIESAEYGYGDAGALVYGREGAWSLLRARDGGAGWLDPSDAGTFHPLTDLLSNGLAHLTDRWDGTMGGAPGAADRTPLPPDPRRRVVGYLQGQVIRERVVLQPGEEPGPVRDRYRASGYSLGRPRADGTRLLTLEVGATHRLHARPDAAAEVIAEVESHRPGYVLATTPNVPSRVPVFDRRSGWFQVALRSDDWRDARRVWLADSATWRFDTFPDAEAAVQFMAGVWGPMTRSVRVLGFREYGDRVWAEIEVQQDSPCVGPEEPVVVTRGWVPLHDDTGAPTVWFSSRGC